MQAFMDFQKKRAYCSYHTRPGARLCLNLLVLVSKNTDFHFPGERSISQIERQFQLLERLK